MKKTTVILLFTLFLAVLLSACSVSKQYIESCTWKLQSVQTSDGDIIAANDEIIKSYPKAELVNMTLNAENGKVKIIDNFSGEEYIGMYSVSSPGGEYVIYDIQIGNISGTGVSSHTDYDDGTSKSTLILSIDKYVLNFQE